MSLLDLITRLGLPILALMLVANAIRHIRTAHTLATRTIMAAMIPCLTSWALFYFWSLQHPLFTEQLPATVWWSRINLTLSLAACLIIQQVAVATEKAIRSHP